MQVPIHSDTKQSDFDLKHLERKDANQICNFGTKKQIKILNCEKKANQIWYCRCQYSQTLSRPHQRGEGLAWTELRIGDFILTPYIKNKHALTVKKLTRKGKIKTKYQRYDWSSG